MAKRLTFDFAQNRNAIRDHLKSIWLRVKKDKETKELSEMYNCFLNTIEILIVQDRQAE